MEKKPISHFVAGLIVGSVAIILFLIYYFTGLSFRSNAWSYIPALMTIGLIIYFVLQYGKANFNNLTFGNLFGYGFKTTAIFAIIMTAFMILVLYIFPDYKEKFMEAMSNQLNKQNNLQEEQKEMAL